jgi:two-component system NtrC family response regulator
MHLPQDVRIKVAKAQLGRGRMGEAFPAAAPAAPPRTLQSGQDAPAREAGAAQRPADDTPIPPVPACPEDTSPRSEDLFCQTLKDCKELAEQHYMRRLVRRAGGDVQRALEISGLSRSHLYALLKKWGLSIDGPGIGDAASDA